MKLATKEILYNKFKYCIMIVVLAATMYLVFFTLGLTTGLRNFGASKFINSDITSFILKEGSNGTLTNSSFSHAYAEEIREDINDKEAFTLGITLSNVRNVYSNIDSPLFDIAYFGVEPGVAMSPQVIKGSIPQNENEVIATENIKENGVQLGDQIFDDRINKTFKIVGFSKPATYNYTPIIYLYPSQFVETSFLGQVTGYADVATVVTYRPKEDLDFLANIYDVEIFSREEIILNTPGLLAQSVSFFLLMVSVYIISATIIAMFFYIVTSHQRKDYALLKAFGKTNSELATVIISKVFIISFMSLGISVLLIYLTEFLLPNIVPFSLEHFKIIRAGIIFIIIGIISSAASLRAMVKVDPIITLGGGEG